MCNKYVSAKIWDSFNRNIIRVMKLDVVLFRVHERKHISYFYICGSVHHHCILLNNQRDVALSSRLYYSLRNYSTCFGCSLLPSSGIH